MIQVFMIRRFVPKNEMDLIRSFERWVILLRKVRGIDDSPSSVFSRERSQLGGKTSSKKYYKWTENEIIAELRFLSNKVQLHSLEENEQSMEKTYVLIVRLF